MTAATETLRAVQGTVNAWSKFFGIVGQIMPAPALAPKWLDQNIISSLINGSNFSFLSTTVNQQKTAEPELEEEIVTRVASYGKQLGRLMEAVDVLAKRAQPGATGDDLIKLNELTELAGDIDTARKQFADDHLDQILAAITKLGRVGHVDHAALGEIKNLVNRLDRG